MSPALLDTSVLVAAEISLDDEVAVSSASIAELHFGVLAATTLEARARRQHRLGAIEATINPLPMDTAVAREWGRLAALVRARGGSPRRRTMDLIIAATAITHRLPLMTHDTADFTIIDDLVEILPAG